MTKPLRVAVVGAGWAGLSAALRLSRANWDVTVFEAAREAGGRARSFDWQDEKTAGQRLDNGQHILIGAYRETLALIDSVVPKRDSVLRREPLTLCDSRGLFLRAAPLPAPLHLAVGILKARGLSFGERLAMVRLMERAKKADWRLARDITVREWLENQQQPASLIERIWAPLCVAALNTPSRIASAQVFLNVLRDSLGAKRHASDLMLPLRSLDLALPRPALEELARRGATLHLGESVELVSCEATEVKLRLHQREQSFDAVVLATPAHRVASLLCGHKGAKWDEITRVCAQLTWQPISTCYLVYDAPVRLPAPMLALQENPARQQFGQWVFARGQLGSRADTLAVVISAEGPHRDLEQDALARLIADQLCSQLHITASLLSSRVITEKRATFACVPDLERPETATPSSRLTLAGDYIRSDYPATLEAAVASGQRAAQLLIDAHRPIA